MNATAVALELRNEVTRHKRLSSQHRQAARDRMERLRAFCAANEITIEEITQRSGDERHGSAAEPRP